MALNIPVNLMNTAAHITQSLSVPAANTAGAIAIRPASGGAGARNASADGGAGSGSAQGHITRQTPQSKRSDRAAASQGPIPTPDRAQARSVVMAQGMAFTPTPAIPASPASVQRASELDRYAPPDPLPTAPILLAASAYAARAGKQ